MWGGSDVINTNVDNDIGAPLETRPRSQAVARFFCSENFLEGRKRGVVETTFGPILAPACAGAPDDDVLITVRPEHASLVRSARPNSIAAVVTGITYMGTYTRIETLVGASVGCPLHNLLAPHSWHPSLYFVDRNVLCPRIT